LLSQAHQELTKREEAQARAGVLNGNGGTKRGAKRKSVEAGVPPSATTNGKISNKKARPSSRARRSKESPSDSEDDDMEEEEEMLMHQSNSRAPSVNGHNKKPETEEEKRKNFLERNRQAALKCRQRKKAWLAQLQAKVEFLSTENERLTTALVSSREEISRLNALVGAGGSATVPNGAHGHGPPVSVAVSLAGPTKSAMGVVGAHGSVSVSAGNPPPAAGVTAGGAGRGYGY